MSGRGAQRPVRLMPPDSGYLIDATVFRLLDREVNRVERIAAREPFSDDDLRALREQLDFLRVTIVNNLRHDQADIIAPRVERARAESRRKRRP